MTKNESTFFWATVEGTDPLVVRRDGETQPLGATPDALVDKSALEEGQRVRCQLHYKRVIILGVAGGEIESSFFWATVDTSSGLDTPTPVKPDGWDETVDAPADDMLVNPLHLLTGQRVRCQWSGGDAIILGASKNAPLMEWGETKITPDESEDDGYSGDQNIRLANDFVDDLQVFLTAHTGVPHKVSLGVTDKSSDSFTINLFRTNQTDTGVYWMAIGS